MNSTTKSPDCGSSQMLRARPTPLLSGLAIFVASSLLSMYASWDTFSALSVLAAFASVVGWALQVTAFLSPENADKLLTKRTSVLLFAFPFATICAVWTAFLCREGLSLWALPTVGLSLIGLLWTLGAFGESKGGSGMENFVGLLNAMGEKGDPETGGKKLAELFNQMKERGAKRFAEFLNRASTDDVHEFASWLVSAARKISQNGRSLPRAVALRVASNYSDGLNNVDCSNNVYRHPHPCLTHATLPTCAYNNTQTGALTPRHRQRQVAISLLRVIRR